MYNMLTFLRAGMYNCVNMSDFEQLLADNGWRKADLGRALGVSATTVSRWNDSPPRYALAYLELRSRVVKVLRV